jgi:HAAS
MTTATLHPLAHEYLERLRTAARRLSHEARREPPADIEAHLAEAIPPDATDADPLNMLERLGDPAEIVAAEAPPSAPEDPRGTREWAAIFPARAR